MRLFLLERIGETGYDEFIAKLIRAPNENSARVLANSETGDEGDVWSSNALVSCKPITTKGEVEVIMVSFNAG